MAPRTSLKLLQHLPVALLLLLCAITSPASAHHSFDINPNPSPEASTSLICPNDNPKDCYPTLFQPTIHFQKIRPDQSLSPGLHVRLNIQTGEKEARLNVPEENEDSKEAVVLNDDVPHGPKTKELGVLDGETPLQLRLQDAPKQEKHARPYTPPRPAAPADPNEVVLYEAAISILKQKSFINERTRVVLNRDIADAIETLTELAHSLEWGLAICRDAELSRMLLASIVTTPANGLEYIAPELRSAVLLLMATAIQNNPDALSALLDLAHDEHGYQGPLHATLQSIALEGSRGGGDPTIVARAIFFLSQLCANDEVLATYLTSDIESFPQLLHLFAASLSEKDAIQAKLRHRIANFVEDHAERIAALLKMEPQADKVMAKEREKSLRLWCNAFSIAMQRHGEGLIGVPEAKEEVGRVLEAYTGRGCGGVVEYNPQQEL